MKQHLGAKFAIVVTGNSFMSALTSGDDKYAAFKAGALKYFAMKGATGCDTVVCRLKFPVFVAFLEDVYRACGTVSWATGKGGKFLQARSGNDTPQFRANRAAVLQAAVSAVDQAVALRAVVEVSKRSLPSTARSPQPTATHLTFV